MTALFLAILTLAVLFSADEFRTSLLWHGASLRAANGWSVTAGAVVWCLGAAGIVAVLS